MVLSVLIGSLLVWSAYTDLKRREIHDFVWILLLLSGIVIEIGGLYPVSWVVVAGMFLGGCLLWRRGDWKSGDVLLFGASGAVVPGQAITLYLVLLLSAVYGWGISWRYVYGERGPFAPVVLVAYFATMSATVLV